MSSTATSPTYTYSLFPAPPRLPKTTRRPVPRARGHAPSSSAGAFGLDGASDALPDSPILRPATARPASARPKSRPSSSRNSVGRSTKAALSSSAKGWISPIGGFPSPIEVLPSPLEDDTPSLNEEILSVAENSDNTKIINLHSPTNESVSPPAENTTPPADRPPISSSVTNSSLPPKSSSSAAQDASKSLEIEQSALTSVSANTSEQTAPLLTSVFPMSKNNFPQSPKAQAPISDFPTLQEHSVLEPAAPEGKKPSTQTIASIRGSARSPTKSQQSVKSKVDSVPKQKKKSGGLWSLKSLVSSQEPSALALAQLEEQTRRQKVSKGATTINVSNVSSSKLPAHVPPVNSKWSGVPETVEQNQGSSKRGEAHERSIRSRSNSTSTNRSLESSKFFSGTARTSSTNERSSGSIHAARSSTTSHTRSSSISETAASAPEVPGRGYTHAHGQDSISSVTPVNLAATETSDSVVTDGHVPPAISEAVIRSSGPGILGPPMTKSSSPIRSASASAKDGEKTATKPRRPDLGRGFVSDSKSMGARGAERRLAATESFYLARSPPSTRTIATIATVSSDKRSAGERPRDKTVAPWAEPDDDDERRASTTYERASVKRKSRLALFK